jgi:hypothetical protein
MLDVLRAEADDLATPRCVNQLCALSRAREAEPSAVRRVLGPPRLGARGAPQAAAKSAGALTSPGPAATRRTHPAGRDGIISATRNPQIGGAIGPHPSGEIDRAVIQQMGYDPLGWVIIARVRKENLQCPRSASIGC